MPLDRSPARSRLPFRLLVTALGIVSLAACERVGRGLPGSGTLKSEKRDVVGFTEVAISGEGELTLSQTGQESLTIEAEDNLLPLLTSTVAHGCLTLGTKAAIHPTNRFGPLEPFAPMPGMRFGRAPFPGPLPSSRRPRVAHPAKRPQHADARVQKRGARRRCRRDPRTTAEPTSS
jgi:hypothetical protein